MSSPDQHGGTRRSGEQGDGTLVLGHIASGQAEGAQPRVAVTSVLYNKDSVDLDLDICWFCSLIPNLRSVLTTVPEPDDDVNA